MRDKLKCYTLSLGILLLLSGCGSTTHTEDVSDITLSDDRFILNRGERKVLDILANDSSRESILLPSTIQFQSMPKHGILEYDEKGSEVVFRADESYLGNDSFTYRVENNSSELSSVATVFLTIEDKDRVWVQDISDIKEWYMKFAVSNTDTKQSFSGVKIGELNQVDATPKYALKAFGALGWNALDIVCKESAKGEDSPLYSVYFSTYVLSNEEKHWRFEVRSSNSHANLELTWQGLFILKPYIDSYNRQRYKEHLDMQSVQLSSMYLVDLNTSIETKAFAPEHKFSYRFNMNGSTTRAFEWVVVPNTQYVTNFSAKKIAIEEQPYKKVAPSKKPAIDLHNVPKGLSQ
jgi:hypothetical protein